MTPEKRKEIKARAKARVANMKNAHHLWSAQKDAEGKVSIYRERDEKEAFEALNKSASRKGGQSNPPDEEWTDEMHQVYDAVQRAKEQINRGEYGKQKNKKTFSPAPEAEFLEDLRQQYFNGEIDAETVMATLANPEVWKARFNAKTKESREVAAACWGLFGASLVDEDLFSQKIPRPIVERFNAAAKKVATGTKIYTWNELETAFGKERIAEVRKFVADGMKTRIVSKTLNIPLVMAVDVLDNFDEGTSNLNKIVAEVKSGSVKSREAQKFEKIYNYYKKTGNHKLAVDEKAKAYYESYYQAYGEQLTKEVKKRVRADLVGKWLRKNGVDSGAVDYWSNYFSQENSNGYGALLTKDLATKLSHH